MADLYASAYTIEPGMMPLICPFSRCLAVYISQLLGFPPLLGLTYFGIIPKQIFAHQIVSCSYSNPLSPHLPPNLIDFR